MSHFDYLAPSGDRWRAGQSAELCRDYDLNTAGLPDWHKVMAGLGQAWECVCRRYAIFEILRTTDPDRMRPATDEAVARELGIKPAHVADLLRQAQEYWAKVRRRDARVGTGLVPPQETRPPMTDEEASALLAQYGMTFKDAPTRVLVAQRCLELRGYLDNDLLRSTVVSLIQQELHLSILDTAITTEQEKTDSLGKSTTDNKEIRELLKARGIIQTKIEETQDRLGIWNTPDAMRKRAAFSDCLGTITLAVQDWYATGSNALLDGVFREAEIEVLLREYDLRKPQYRPDLALVVVPGAIEGLFDPNYKAPPFPRHAARRLAGSFRAALAALRQEDGEEVGDLDTDPEDFND